MHFKQMHLIEFQGEIPPQANFQTELVLPMGHLADSAVMAKQIQIWTRRDYTIVHIIALLAIWLAKQSQLKPVQLFFQMFLAFSAHEECVL